MSYDVETLEPAIREILSAPGTDLDTISAKRVRKQLLETVPGLTADVVKEHKDDIDALIGTVFRAVKGEQPDDADEHSNKRAHEDDGEDDEGEDEAASGSASPPPKAKKARKGDVSDAQLAKKLSDEINGRPRSSRAGIKGTRGRGGKRGGKAGRKSAAAVGSDAEAEGSGGEEKPKKKRGGGFQKEYKLSEPLSAVVKAEQLSRPQVVKQLWDYIKANNLQNPENKKEIVCDDSFRAIFNVDRVDMFRMNKLLGSHLYPQA